MESLVLKKANEISDEHDSKYDSYYKGLHHLLSRIFIRQATFSLANRVTNYSGLPETQGFLGLKDFQCKIFSFNMLSKFMSLLGLQKKKKKNSAPTKGESLEEKA